MRTLKLSFLVLSVIILSVALLGVYSAMAQDEEEKEPKFAMLIGTVTDAEDEFVGIAIEEDGSATLYLCDGQADKGTATLAEWFIGTVTDNALDVTAKSGNRVQLTIAGDTATGSFTFGDGSVKNFELAKAEGDSGLFRSEFSLGELDYIGGWLVLPDGSVRGAISQPDTGILFPANFFQFRQYVEQENLAK